MGHRLTSRPVPGDWNGVINALMRVDHALNTSSSPTFESLTLSDLTANAVLYPNDDGTLTSLAAATNGQLVIGSTGSPPSVAALTGTANQVTVTPGAGSITLSLPQDIHTGASPSFANLSLGTGELTCGSINRASGTLTLEIAGTPELSVSTDLIAITSGLTVDTDTLVVDSVGHEVGFGTASPGAQISLGANTARSSFVTATDDTNVHIYRSTGSETFPFNGGQSLVFQSRVNNGDLSGSNLVFVTGETPAVRMVIDKFGNFGVGTSTPNYLLDVGDDTRDEDTILRLVVNSEGHNSGIRMIEAADDKFGFSFFYNGNDNRFDWNRHNDSQSGSTFMSMLRNTGFIGIGGEKNPETITEWTSTAPYLTLHNSTEENGDGGRESRINFKGERLDTTEHTLARIEVSHDGAADDEKGKFVISVNDGNDGDTPTAVIKISADGSTAIGDGGTTNYSQFSATGVQTLHGTARVLRSVDFEPEAVKQGGVGPGASTEDGFPLHDYSAANDESVFIHWEIPHSYASAGEIHLHVEYFVDTAPVAAANVTWGVEYKKLSIGDNFDFGAGTTTVIVNDALTTGTPANDKSIHSSDEIHLVTTGFEPMDVVLIRIFRDADASEVGATDNYGSDARVFNYHLMYLSDKFGQGS